MPRADAKAHLANGIARSEAVLKLYLRYDAQLHRHYRNCLKDLRDLQAQRLSPEDHPVEPKPPVAETEIPAPSEPIVVPEAPKPSEANLTPEQARFEYMKAEVERFENQQAILRARMNFRS